MASELENLRDEVRRRQRAANAKVSRLRSKNLDISNTKYDVRRDPSKIGRYNATQLRNYLEQLNTFTSRSTRFVALKGGAPAPYQKWSAYKKDEARYNAKVGRAYKHVKGYENKPRGMTVEEYDTNMRPAKIEAAGRASHRPLSPINRVPHRIESVEALDKLHNDIRRRNKREYVPSQIAKQRDAARKMLNRIGNPHYITQFEKMSDHQFDVVFNYMNFADDVSLRYLNVQQLGKDDYEEFGMQEDESDAIQYWFDIALNDIPREPERRPNTPNKRTPRRK